MYTSGGPERGLLRLSLGPVHAAIDIAKVDHNEEIKKEIAEKRDLMDVANKEGEFHISQDSFNGIDALASQLRRGETFSRQPRVTFRIGRLGFQKIIPITV